MIWRYVCNCSKVITEEKMEGFNGQAANSESVQNMFLRSQRSYFSKEWSGYIPHEMMRIDESNDFVEVSRITNPMN